MTFPTQWSFTIPHSQTLFVFSGKKKNSIKSIGRSKIKSAAGKNTCKLARNGPVLTQTHRLWGLVVEIIVYVVRSKSITKIDFFIFYLKKCKLIKYFDDGSCDWTGCVSIGNTGQISQLGRRRCVLCPGGLIDEVFPHCKTGPVVWWRYSNHPLEALCQTLYINSI